MKISTCILLIVLTSAEMLFAKKTTGQEMSGKMITLELKSETLGNALEKIGRLSGFRIGYLPRIIEKYKGINLAKETRSVEATLKLVLANTPLDFRQQNATILVFKQRKKMISEYGAAQNPDSISFAAEELMTISGTVSEEDGAPLQGASVLAKGLSVGATTDAAGKFTIKVPDNTTTLVFSSVGFVAKEVQINGRTTINIVLARTSNSLNDVVVVAYGTQRKSQITGSVNVIKESDLKDLPVTQFTQKLQGRTPGVQISQNTGIPGQGMSVRIRGAASISGSSQPLYVVDGFPIVGDISNINPDEIESFSILKDASATALYGSRAANGVVLVETKRAKSGQSNLSFDAFYGVQEVPKKGRPDMMNAEEFAQYENEVFQQKILLGQATEIPTEYQNPSSWAGKGTDWYGLLLRKAPIQNYSLSISGNKDKLSTSATFGYLNQEGVLLNSNYKRYSLRLNSEYKFNDKISIGANIAPSYSTNSTPNSDGNIFGGGIIQNAIASSPIAPAVNPDGTLPLTATSPGLFPNPNWYRVAQEVKNNTTTGRILSNVYLNLELIKNLNFRSSVNIDYTNIQNNTFSPSTAGNLFSPPPSQTSASTTGNIFYSWLTENTLNYKRSFGNHNLDLLAGYTAQKFRQDLASVSATGFPNDNIQTLNAGTLFNHTFDVQEWSLASFVSRVNYNYAGKYLLSATFRRDGSSRFAPNTKNGNFPSISAGWNVSDESFMSGVPLISNLKIRAGYGLNGNFNIGNYGYLSRTAETNYAFNNALANGITIANIGNNNLSWEKSRQFDIGLDIGFFKDRIFFTYDYFYKTTSDMLLDVNVPRESGFGSITDNVGKFEFRGHEFSISSQNTVGKLRWTTNLNITFIRNKVLNLGPYKKFLPRADTNLPTITEIGSPIGAFYGFKFIGVYKDQADFDKSPKYLGGDAPSAVGTVKYADLDGDGVITVADKEIIGDPNPDFLFGITNNLSYQNFDFSVTASGTYGNDIQNRTLEYIQNLDGVFNVTKDVGRRWKSEQDPGDGIHPRAVVSTALARYTNSRWVSDASFLTIKNITLGYTQPTDRIKYIRSIRLYGSIQQAWVFTKYKGANPEVNDSGTNALVQGIDATSYPVPRTFSVGINMSLK